MKKIIRFSIVCSAIITMFMCVSCYPGYRAHHHNDNEQRHGDRDHYEDHHWWMFPLFKWKITCFILYHHFKQRNWKTQKQKRRVLKIISRQRLIIQKQRSTIWMRWNIMKRAIARKLLTVPCLLLAITALPANSWAMRQSIMRICRSKRTISNVLRSLEYQIIRHENNFSFKILFVLFCFAKKEPKKATRKRYKTRFREELRLSFCATVVNSSGSLIGS